MDFTEGRYDTLGENVDGKVKEESCKEVEIKMKLLSNKEKITEWNVDGVKEKKNNDNNDNNNIDNDNNNDNNKSIDRNDNDNSCNNNNNGNYNISDNNNNYDNMNNKIVKSNDPLKSGNEIYIDLVSLNNNNNDNDNDIDYNDDSNYILENDTYRGGVLVCGLFRGELVKCSNDAALRSQVFSGSRSRENDKVSSFSSIFYFIFILTFI